ncbi:hypothetical protein DSCW_56760 [Desulfosarcina widdelii]|uniref:Adenine DNA glycosylase n=2 Tax=Desulfosarcina widdelii TaxID=947919 RepID=A0A5K7ZDJ0_9BACT|nr:NUDIX domain-containing protein [Desulfosarcina widdelii]BBO78259.1 hypothetical protein DSCW_56760 [Desulfosarcina widdelii]
MLVVQRQLEGFLGGLWEFPAIPADGRPTVAEDFEKKLKAETGLTVSMERQLTRIRHAYTHFKLTGDVFLCRYSAGRVRLNSARSHRWISFGTLSDLPLHKANHKFLDVLELALGE